MNSNNFFTRLFWNYIYSGGEWNSVQSREVSFINSFSIIGILCAAGFGTYQALLGDINGSVEIGASVIGLLNVMYLRKSLNTTRASGVILLSMIVLLSFLFVDGGIAGTGIFWMFTFPILAFFLFDEEVGFWWNVALLAVLSLISLVSIAGLIEIHYHWIVLRQVLFSFLAVVGLLYFYTKFSSINSGILAGRTKKIEEVFKIEKEKIETEAHKVEKTFKDRLNSFFHTAGDVMGLANYEGYFIEINPAFTKILGYSPEEILNTPFIEFVHPEDKEKTNHAMEMLIQGEIVENFTNRYRRKDGKYTWFMWNATSQNGAIYSIAHPIDGLMEAQEQLQKKNKELEKMNRLMIDRELTMIEMKKELAALKGEKLPE